MPFPVNMIILKAFLKLVMILKTGDSTEIISILSTSSNLGGSVSTAVAGHFAGFHLLSRFCLKVFYKLKDAHSKAVLHLCVQLKSAISTVQLSGLGSQVLNSIVFPAPLLA